MENGVIGVIGIVITCLFVSNIILSNFLGICPFLGISKKPGNAIGMGLALLFVVTMSSIICYGIQKLILKPLGLEYLQLLVFILVIASFVQFVEFFMKKYMKGLYKSLGIYLPLITTNCVVLFVAQTIAKYEVNPDILAMCNNNAFLSELVVFGNALIYSIATAIGYMLVITLFSFIRVRIDGQQETPKAFKGNAIALITTALLALTFMAFVGLA